MKTTNPDRDETETRLSKIKANETRPRRDTLKKFHPRRDLDKTTSRVSVLLVSRPKLSPISAELFQKLAKIVKNWAIDSPK